MSSEILSWQRTSWLCTVKKISLCNPPFFNEVIWSPWGSIGLLNSICKVMVLKSSMKTRKYQLRFEISLIFLIALTLESQTMELFDMASFLPLTLIIIYLYHIILQLISLSCLLIRIVYLYSIYHHFYFLFFIFFCPST